MNSILVSVALSVYLTTFVGFLNYPFGAGLTPCLITLLFVARNKLIRSGGWRGFQEWVDFLPATGLAFVPAISTNTIVLSVSVGILSFYLFLLFLRAASGSPSLSMTTLFAHAGVYLRYFLIRFRAVWWKSIDPRSYHMNRTVVLGILFSMLPLTIFHLLFSRVNDQYASTMARMLEFIFDIDLIIRAGQVWLHAVLFHSIFTTVLPSAALPPEEVPRSPIVTISLVPVLLLFVIFSCFQSSAVAWAVPFDSFQSLSLYVQRGFWELLVVASLGYLLWLLVYRRGAVVTEQITAPKLLSKFTVLLLLVAVFTAHKLALLQGMFGLKDSRLYASFAVTMCVLTLALSFVHLLKRISSTTVLHGSLTTLLLASCILAFSNVDLVASHVNPIRFHVGNEQRRDLSYLLGNSCDNVEAWEELMKEGLDRGIPNAPGYYWGYYLPLCKSSKGMTGMTYLREQHDLLVEQYSRDIRSLRQLGRYTVRGYQAYRWVLQHDQLLNNFYQIADLSC